MTTPFLTMIRASFLAGLAGMAALATLIAGMLLWPILAIGLPIAVLGGIALLAEPFLGVAALTFFGHLDAIEKLLFGFLPISAFKLITGATVAVVVVSGVRFREGLVYVLHEPVTVFALLFASLAMVSLLFAGDLGLALDSVVKNASLLVLTLLIVALVDDRRKLAILLWMLVITSVLSAFILIADTVLGTKLVAQSEAALTARTSEGISRSSGASDYNPTTAASMLLVGVIFALVHFLETPRYRFVLLGCIAVGALALMLSFARSSALGFAVVVLALAWRYRRERFIPLAGLGAIAAGLCAIPFVPPEYWERLASVFDGGGDWTLGRRMTYNLIGLDLLAERPFFGVGPGNFAARFTDPEYRYYPGRTVIGRELHNMYLSVLVQYGVIGAAAFFGMIGFGVRRLIETLRAPADEQMRIFALCMVYAFGGYLLVSLFLPNEYTKYTWILSGLAASVYRVNEIEKRKAL